MAGYNIPTDVVTKYKQSVHYEALTKKGDLSAPTCNICHGNHGATPPGVESVANVLRNWSQRARGTLRQEPTPKAFASMGLFPA